VVAELARRRGVRFGAPAGKDAGEECHTLVARDGDLLLAQPQTYMNRSGHAAHCLVERHGFLPEEVLVVFDDVNLPFGRLRLRRGGSPGGHRGMESIAEGLRTDQIPRLRLGVAEEAGPPAGGDDLVEFVLAPFKAEERPAVEAMVARAADACEVWLAEGIEAAMRGFNG
jgi:PTH1 family peptidyl-tRNA hydrolase